MSEVDKPVFESNGLLDFFPTPPHSTEDGDAQSLPYRQQAPMQKTEELQRSERFSYDDESPPPDFDEEPSDFEDEVKGIMEREKESSGRPAYMGMDVDDGEEVPVASCESSLLMDGEWKADNTASRRNPPVYLTPPPENRSDHTPQLEMLPAFASSLEVIAPLRVETASGKKVIFRRRAKPVPKPIPVRSTRRTIVYADESARRERCKCCRRIEFTFCAYS